MAVYFADSSFWIALIDQRDAHHSQAAEWSLKMSGQIVTTEAVLLETANTFSKPGWRDKVMALINHVQPVTTSRLCHSLRQFGHKAGGCSANAPINLGV